MVDTRAGVRNGGDNLANRDSTATWYLPAAPPTVLLADKFSDHATKFGPDSGSDSLPNICANRASDDGANICTNTCNDHDTNLNSDICTH